jgi:hypothetical protein
MAQQTSSEKTRVDLVVLILVERGPLSDAIRISRIIIRPVIASASKPAIASVFWSRAGARRSAQARERETTRSRCVSKLTCAARAKSQDRPKIHGPFRRTQSAGRYFL